MRPHLRSPRQRPATHPQVARPRATNVRSLRTRGVGWRRRAIAIATSAMIASACTAAAAGPEEVLRSYIEAYNANDVDGLEELFAEDALMTGHPFGPHADGVDKILDVHAADRAAASNETPYEISNVEVTGNTVSWDHVWTNGNGASYCAEGHKAVIEDGKIVSWEFAPNPHPCP